MATILLSAVGAAVGSTATGTIMGLTGAVVGRAVGATIGRIIDQRIMGAGSDPVEVGRIEQFRLTGASEGAPVAQLFGRMRIGGQVIWSTQFQERATTTGGGKGAPAQPQTTSYSYSVSLALALCEGEILRVGRVWADGVLLARDEITMRVYRGGADQMPDPLMEAVEGAGMVPAYRGIAYVVIEDMDLAPFGNRVPQLSFEVVRPARPGDGAGLPSPGDAIEAVALMPGTGEYALATTPVTYSRGLGATSSANINNAGGVTDLTASLDALREEVPRVGAVSLIASWFGDDLRAGQCSIRPKVEQRTDDGTQMPWTVSGLSRWAADEIAKLDGRPVYGGTPADASVIEAIAAIRDGGQEVMFYPFLLMEILQGNGLPDPWAATGEQPALPWRGRITGDKAAGVPGSTDGSAANAAAADAFFGTARAADFAVSGGQVFYTGPAEWSYSRFILHYAALCAAAGGVAAFCIGSEMRGLTQMRDDNGFPAVDHLRQLAAEVRSLLPGAMIGYAADWSEYAGYRPLDGSGDVYFNLDPLWADANIDFIGIDNYMPLSDWRDGTGHADAGWRSVHDIGYLQSNIEGGEGYDWYYASQEGRDAQIRLPIEDGAGGEPWIYRYKDIRGWWSNPHVERKPPQERSILVGGDRPDTWQTVLWATATPVPDTFGPYTDAVRIATGQHPNDRIISPVKFATDEDETFELRLTFKAGTSNGYRAFLIHQAGNVNILGDTALEPSAITAAHEILESGLISHGDGIHTVRVVVRFTSAAQVRVDFGPGVGTAGEDVILFGAEVIPWPYRATDWVPKSKPVWFTEIGCAAIDKGTNQPNRFLDPKSSESGLPHYSDGRRDDLIQAQYLRATIGYWSDPANNPVSPVYGGPMIDPARIFVWAWDARPWPAFPNDTARWSDGENHARGHWITGRIAAQPLALVVAEICEAAGVADYDVSALNGLVRGHVSADVETARARLQPLMLAHGFGAVERDGKLVFLPLPLIPDGEVRADLTAVGEDGSAAIRQVRAPEAEIVGRVRVGFTEADGAFEARVAEAVFPDDTAVGAGQSDLPLALTAAEGREIAQRWLAESRVARDSVEFTLPPSRRDVAAGTMIALEDGSTWRVDRIEDTGPRKIEAVRVEPTVFEPSDAVEEAVTQTAFVPPVPVSPVFLDLPLLTGEEVPHAPHVAVAATPWPGSVAVYSSASDSGFALNRLVEAASVMGTLEGALPAAAPGLWDRGAPVRVRIIGGALSSASPEEVLNGANVAAIGTGDEGPWEVVQFADATLVAPDLWEISMRLRGQAGSDGVTPAFWPQGSLFVLLDGRPGQIELPMPARGLSRFYRVGPARRPLDDASYVARQLAFDGIGLRPYRPAHLQARPGAAGLDLTWIRRTRIDGDSWQGTEVPLGEDSEAYLVRVSDAGGIRREATVGAPAWSYGDAIRAADGVNAPYTIEVAQISERFGPGPFARIDIDD